MSWASSFLLSRMWNFFFMTSSLSLLKTWPIKWEWKAKHRLAALDCQCPSAWLIGWGHWVTILLPLSLLPWQKATHSHMSAKEVLQIKARFNGCFSYFIVGEFIVQSKNHILRECRQKAKERRTCLVKSCVILMHFTFVLYHFVFVPVTVM